MGGSAGRRGGGKGIDGECRSFRTKKKGKEKKKRQGLWEDKISGLVNLERKMVEQRGARILASRLQRSCPVSYGAPSTDDSV